MIETKNTLLKASKVILAGMMAMTLGGCINIYQGTPAGPGSAGTEKPTDPPAAPENTDKPADQTDKPADNGTKTEDTKQTAAWVKEKAFAGSDAVTLKSMPLIRMGVYKENTGYALGWEWGSPEVKYDEGYIAFVQGGYTGIMSYDGTVTIEPTHYVGSANMQAGSGVGLAADAMNGYMMDFDGYYSKVMALDSDMKGLHEKQLNPWGLDEVRRYRIYKGTVIADADPDKKAVNELDFTGRAALRRDQACGGGIVDNTGSILAEFDYDISYSKTAFVNGFVTVENDNGKYGFVDASTGTLIGEWYEDVEFFEDGYCPVKKNGKWGFIDETGKAVTDFIFDDATALYQGRTFVSGNGTYGILDLKATLIAGIPVTEETCWPEGKPAVTELSSPVVGTAKVKVSNLNIRENAHTDSASKGHAEMGKTYDVYAVARDESYTWYRIGEGQWIASDGSWVEFTHR